MTPPSSAASAYAESLRWLYALGSEGMKFGLGRMRRVATQRGQSLGQTPIVHVAGSNGKGSTCAMIERGLREAGYKTGWFSSPHLHRYAERFRISGRPLSDGEVARRLTAFRKAKLGLTFFEHSVLLAFEAFAEHQCDVIVLEVGLGGRLDATNIIASSAVSVVTRIALEHTAILGHDRRTIAKEKGGIFRHGGRAIIGANAPEAKSVLKEMAVRRKMDPWLIGDDFGFDTLPRGRTRVSVREEVIEIKLGLAGGFQQENAAIAAAALVRLRDAGFRIPASAITLGLKKAKWPGRLEQVVVDGQEYIFDCAHNPDGSRALAAHLRTLPEKRTVLLFGAMADKDHERMLSPFDDVVSRRVYAIPAMRRAVDPAHLKTVRPGEVRSTVLAGSRHARRLAGPDGRIVVCGSIFLLNEVRADVLGLERDPPIAL